MVGFVSLAYDQIDAYVAAKAKENRLSRKLAKYKSDKDVPPTLLAKVDEADAAHIAARAALEARLREAAVSLGYQVGPNTVR